MQETYQFNFRIRKIPWRRSWKPTSYFCLENPMNRGSLVGYNPWGHKELDMTEQTQHTAENPTSQRPGCWKWIQAFQSFCDNLRVFHLDLNPVYMDI